MEIKGHEIESFLETDSINESRIGKLPETLQNELREGQEKLRLCIESTLGSSALRACAAFCKGDHYGAAEEILKYPGKISPSDPLKTIVEKVVEAYLQGELHHDGTVVEINKLLAKIGFQLNQSPWKEKFIEMVENRLDTTFPPNDKATKDNLNEIIQEAKNAGFEEKEIIEALRLGVENAEKEKGIGLRTFEARVALDITTTKEYLQELMKQGDSSIHEGYNFTIEHGIDIFRVIQERINIGRKRRALIRKFDQLMKKYDGYMHDEMVGEFRKYAAKRGITVSYPSSFGDD